MHQAGQTAPPQTKKETQPNMSTNHLVILLSLAAACMIGTLCLINTIPLLALICLGTSGALTFATLGEMTNR